MKLISDESWNWLKTAPLPVVLSMCLTSFSILGAWLWSVEKAQAQQKTEVAVAVEQAKQAQQSATKAEQKLDKANEKLDKLLEAVVSMKAAAEEKEKSEKAKKGDKK